MKPKLPNQFKAAEVNGIPFTVVIGEDEMAQGKVKIKEMGLREGHPEKEGVLVNISDLVPAIKQRLERKADLDSMVEQAEGLRVVRGIKGDPLAIEKTESDKPEETSTEEKANQTSVERAVEQTKATGEVPDPEKPAS